VNKTKIEYLDYSWSPIKMLCTPKSEGCANCWHLAMDKRFWKHSGPPVLRTNELMAPCRIKKPSTIGVQFSGDLFHEDVSWPNIDDVFYAIHECVDRHTFVLLTKRVETAWYYFNSPVFESRGDHRSEFLDHDNIWFGASVENQRRADERIPLLLQIPARNRWVSVEPMLDDIRLDAPEQGYLWSVGIKDTLDWVVCGAESGIRARACALGWVRSIRDQCSDKHVPFYYKQGPGDHGYNLKKKPFLDGRQWLEMPGDIK